MADYRHPSHARRRDTRSGRRAQRKILEPGPWCWPDPALDPDARRSATHAFGARPTTPRVLRAGEVVLVTVHDDGEHVLGELWALSMRDDPRKDADAEFLSGALGAWLDAQCALPRALPLLWNSVHEQDGRLGPVRALYQAPTNTTPTLDGRSFGLAFGLALASSVIGMSAPPDVVATATLDERGALGRVDGLRDKLLVIDRIALSVRRVAVAKEQEDEARALLAELGITRLEVVGFATLAAALGALLEDPARSIDSASKADRNELVRSFFRLALGERHASVEWEPIQRAADRALDRWSNDLDPSHRSTLEFARAVAARHHDNSGQLTLPTSEWLARFTLPQRLRVLAHTAQQSADTGSPPPESVLALAREHCPDLTILTAEPPTNLAADAYDSRGVDGCFAPHLRLLGAIGRMRYTTRGDLRGAIRDQLAVCVGWQRAWNYDETTYPLSALFTYISVFALEPDADLSECAALFERVEKLWKESRRGGRGCRDNLYIRLGLGRALAALGRHDEAIEQLDPLVSDLGRHAERMRLSAARWRLRCAHGDDDAAAAALATSDDQHATLYVALRDLDLALGVGDAAAAHAAAVIVHGRQRDLCATLLRSADLTLGDPAAAAFLARCYPY